MSNMGIRVAWVSGIVVGVALLGSWLTYDTEPGSIEATAAPAEEPLGGAAAGEFVAPSRQARDEPPDQPMSLGETTPPNGAEPVRRAPTQLAPSMLGPRTLDPDVAFRSGRLQKGTSPRAVLHADPKPLGVLVPTTALDLPEGNDPDTGVMSGQ